jgi:uncharacterized membrane protein YcaP (DUF421 family)
VDALWQLEGPWWIGVVRAALIYSVLLLFIRLSGKRTVGEFTPFDLVVLILIGEASQNGLIGDDHSVVGAWIAAGTLIAINWAVSWIAARSRRVERWIEGTPQVLARDGRALPAALRAHNLSPADFELVLRSKKCRIEEVRLALLEVDGEITLIKTNEEVPLPQDLEAPR